MRLIVGFDLLVSLAYCQTTFKVFHNTLDPSVFGQNGGAILNATGDGFVDALTLCVRFQGSDSSRSHISIRHCQNLPISRNYFMKETYNHKIRDITDINIILYLSLISLQFWEVWIGVLEAH